MKVKRMTVLLATAVVMGAFSMFSIGCAGMSNGHTHSAVSKKVHDEHFPAGHSGSLDCHWDQKAGVYLCPY